jgi:hypothetical protein
MASVSLSAAGLSHVAISEAANDFEFVVSGATHRCPSWMAAFLSPYIAAIRSIDGTFSSFHIQTPDDQGLFQEVLSLGRGKRLVLSDLNRDFLFSVAKELRNSKLFLLLFQKYEGSISITNVANRIRSLAHMEANIDSEIEFLASHLHEMSSSDILELSFETVCDILRHPRLKIGSEDSLYQMISMRVSSDSRFFQLFTLIHFEFLTDETFADYITLVSNAFELFTIAHWQLLSSRLYRSSRTVMLPYNESTPYNGIIASLTRCGGGNVHDRGLVNITTWRDNSSHPVKNVANLDDNSIYDAPGAWSTPNHWICFDFKSMEVTPTHYTIRSYGGGPNTWHLKSWEIRGSNDGKTWDTMDQRKDNMDLNNAYAEKTFTISKPGPFRRIGLYPIDVAHNGYQAFVLCRLEFFGSLRLP